MSNEQAMPEGALNTLRIIKNKCEHGLEYMPVAQQMVEEILTLTERYVRGDWISQSTIQDSNKVEALPLGSASQEKGGGDGPAGEELSASRAATESRNGNPVSSPEPSPTSSKDKHDCDAEDCFVTQCPACNEHHAPHCLDSPLCYCHGKLPCPGERSAGTDVTQTVEQDMLMHLLSDVAKRRGQIKEDWVKTWLAVNVSDENLTPEWLINNVEIVEQWGDDRMSVSWKLRLKAPAGVQPGELRCSHGPYKIQGTTGCSNCEDGRVTLYYLKDLCVACENAATTRPVQKDAHGDPFCRDCTYSTNGVLDTACPKHSGYTPLGFGRRRQG